MKKTLIALATLGVVGAASAQVSISGGIAAGVQNKLGATKPNFHLTNADIVFSAKEDLGGGLSVSASTGISNEGLHGNATAVEKAKISISGGFGKFEYANGITGNSGKMGGPSVEDDLVDILSGYKYFNQFQYVSPEIVPGLTAELEWTKSDSDKTAAYDLEASGTPQLVLNYKSGPMTLYYDNGGAKANWDVRGTYDFGMAKIGLRQDKEKFQEVAITVPMGATTVGVYTAKGKGGEDASGFSAAYALSKRTSLSVGYLSSKKSVSGKNSGNGGNNYRINLAHKF